MNDSAQPPKRPNTPIEADQAPVEEPVLGSNPTPALVFSLVLHLFLLLSILWLVSVTPKGTGEVLDRQIGIAMVHRLPNRDSYQEIKPEQTKENESQSMAESAAAAAAPPVDVAPALDLDGVLAAMESTPAPTAGTGLSGDSPIDGDAFGDGGGLNPNKSNQAKTTAKLFGVSGSGSRFVYVFDRSDSMNGFGGLPLKTAKRELIRSLNSLSPQQQFQIIFYNENVKPFQLGGSPLSMIPGERSQISRAEGYVRSIPAFGGTKHKGALLMALRMSPDVIFFLTDADIPGLSRSELMVIQDRAQRNGTTIHAVEFGSRGAPAPGSFLRQLAAMNQGQYQYVDVRGFGREESAQEESGQEESGQSDAATDKQESIAEESP